MTCKSHKIISSDSESTFSIFYSYVLLPMLVVYLCIPIASLIKYIFTDIMKVYNVETKKDLKPYSPENSEELIKIKVENALLKDQIQQKKYIRDMLSVLKNYEYTLQRFVEEHKKVLREKEALQEMLNLMNEEYQELNVKYITAKEAVDNLEKNEENLRKHFQEWKTTMLAIEKRYEKFKDYAASKLDNSQSSTQSSENSSKQKICKLKAKVIEGQSRINQLETQISAMSEKCPGIKGVQKVPSNIFKPLVTNIH